MMLILLILMYKCLSLTRPRLRIKLRKSIVVRLLLRMTRIQSFTFVLLSPQILMYQGAEKS